MAHECVQCGDAIPDRRYELGYRVCLSCGERNATEARKSWCVVPMSKSNYTLVTDKQLLKGLNKYVPT